MLSNWTPAPTLLFLSTKSPVSLLNNQSQLRLEIAKEVIIIINNKNPKMKQTSQTSKQNQQPKHLLRKPTHLQGHNL